MKNIHSKLEEAFQLIAQTNAKRILFACVPGDGHFSPLTGIAKQLQNSGYDVRWYTSAIYAEKLKKIKIRHYPFKKALEVTGENVGHIFPERDKIKNPIKKLNFDIINFFIKRGPEYYEDMYDIYESFPFDLVIADCAFSGIPFITDKMDIPVITIGVFPLVESSKDLAPNGLGITPSYSVAGRWKQSVMRFIANNILFRPSNNVMKRILDEHAIRAEKGFLFDLLVKKSTLLLQSGTPGFEYKRTDMGKNIRFIGPLLPFTQAGEKPTWFDGRLISYRNIILVTQGTVEKDVEKLLVPTLEAFKGTSTLVIATTGGSKTAELKQRFPQGNIIIEDFIPFADVMPYAKLYITNGGYGGVMLGIQNQLPLIVAGVHEGKNEICARVGYFNLGINLKTERPTAYQLKNAVEEVFRNNIYKKNVIHLANEFGLYDPNTLIENYVSEILKEKRQQLPIKGVNIISN